MVTRPPSRVPVSNTFVETSQSRTDPDPSGSRSGAVDGSPPVDLVRVWCRRLREGDRGALEAVFRALYEPLVGYAGRYVPPGDRDAAADVVQDAFLRVWEGRERLDPDRSLKAFLYQTVRNLALNRSRDARTRATLLAEHYAPPVAPVEDPDEALDASRLRERLEEWIEALPARQREALRLSRFDGLDHGEIAEVMGCSPRTVNNHLVRALKTIRARAAELDPDRSSR